jgi:hypothetical protein
MKKERMEDKRTGKEIWENGEKSYESLWSKWRDSC